MIQIARHHDARRQRDERAVATEGAIATVVVCGMIYSVYYAAGREVNSMTEDEAISRARQITADNGWPWIEPVQTVIRRRLFRGGLWTVTTICQQRGCNVCMEIDDTTEVVIEAVFRPR